MTLLRWMVGTAIALVLMVLAAQGVLYMKLADLALQIGTVVGRLH